MGRLEDGWRNEWMREQAGVRVGGFFLIYHDVFKKFSLIRLFNKGLFDEVLIHIIWDKRINMPAAW